MNYKLNHLPIFIATMLLASSCATITNGVNQSLSVDTEPDVGAMCQLTNDKGKWYVNDTPGSVMVNRSWSDLTVTCKKGEKTGIVSVKSKSKATNAGNILLGGIAGLALDAHTGAGYDYPSVIHVPLK